MPSAFFTAVQVPELEVFLVDSGGITRGAGPGTERGCGDRRTARFGPWADAGLSGPDLR